MPLDFAVRLMKNQREFFKKTSKIIGEKKTYNKTIDVWGNTPDKFARYVLFSSVLPIMLTFSYSNENNITPNGVFPQKINRLC